MEPKNLPFEIKEYLNEISQVFPEKARQIFLSDAARGICNYATELISDHKNTIVFAAIGYMLAYIVKNAIRSIPVIGTILGPIVDLAPLVAGLSGAGYGFIRDQEAARFERILRDAVIAAQACNA